MRHNSPNRQGNHRELDLYVPKQVFLKSSWNIYGDKSYVRTPLRTNLVSDRTASAKSLRLIPSWESSTQRHGGRHVWVTVLTNRADTQNKTHSHTHTHTHTHTHIHSHALYLSLSLTHTHTHIILEGGISVSPCPDECYFKICCSLSCFRLCCRLRETSQPVFPFSGPPLEEKEKTIAYAIKEMQNSKNAAHFSLCWLENLS